MNFVRSTKRWESKQIVLRCGDEYKPLSEDVLRQRSQL